MTQTNTIDLGQCATIKAQLLEPMYVGAEYPRGPLRSLREADL